MDSTRSHVRLELAAKAPYSGSGRLFAPFLARLADGIPPAVIPIIPIVFIPAGSG
jgi:hypothetical protein